jgi:hypothetical protein
MVDYVGFQPKRPDWDAIMMTENKDAHLAKQITHFTKEGGRAIGDGKEGSNQKQNRTKKGLSWTFDIQIVTPCVCLGGTAIKS